MKARPLGAFVLMGIAVLCFRASAEERQPITAKECVTARYLASGKSLRNPLEINRQGDRVAYLVKSPNLATNRNDIELYIASLDSKGETPAKLLASSSYISDIYWLEDGRSVTVLIESGGKRSIEKINTDTGKRESLAIASNDILEYSLNQAGDTVVYTTDAGEQTFNTTIPAEEIARGFRIPFQDSAVSAFPRQRRRVFSKSARNGVWQRPKELILRSPFTGKVLFPQVDELGLRLSLSPNGRELLLRYLDLADNLPREWKEDPYVQSLADISFSGLPLLVLYDLDSGKMSLPLETPYAWNIPLWSPDSSSFLITAQSPIGSAWEKEDLANHRLKEGGTHLFLVNIETKHVEQLMPHSPSNYEQALTWTAEDSVLLRTGNGVVARLSRRDARWLQTESFRLPLEKPFSLSALASDGRKIIGCFETPTASPELFTYQFGSPGIKALLNLNPQFKKLSFAAMRQISWQTSSGFKIDGFLFIPPDYSEGKRYPLVIQAHQNQGEFVCDSGESHFPSYAPQPLATGGIMYLMRTYPENFQLTEEELHYPKDLPGLRGYGGLGEAAFAMDVWDSAVADLDRKGLIDPENVGILGFSRKGWYTEYILAHAKTHFRAATVADNVEYSLGEYWLYHVPSVIHGWDAFYGGPPYGESLKNWMKYSVSFNLDKFHTPLLMEELGHGKPFSEEAPSLGLAMKYEVFTGLNRLHKPVEMYYYPEEEHQPDHPQARLASIQRNIDWYRFWLQNYERPKPEDREQYVRWRRLRKMQQAEEAERKRSSTGSN